MATKKKQPANATHIALRPIKHDGEYYNLGDEIALTDEQADNLDSNVRPITDADKKAAE